MIILQNGDVFEVKDIFIRVDSTSWLEAKDNIRQTVSSHELMEIKFVDHTQGALDASYLGFLSGFLTMGGLVYIFYPDKPNDALETGLEFGIGMVAIMAPVGAIVGSTDTYVLNNSKDSTITSQLSF